MPSNNRGRVVKRRPTSARQPSSNESTINGSAAALPKCNTGNTHPVAEGNNEYIYTDEAGSPLFRVQRHETKKGKTFSQSAPDGKGWTRRLNGARRVLYRLPQVIEALEAGEPVYVAEGEKDVQALEAAGVVATCNPGGAGKWKDDYVDDLSLEDAAFCVIWDKDGPPDLTGERHALAVAASLETAGAKVSMLRARVGKDAADHLAAGYSVAELVKQRPQVPAAPERQPEQAGPAPLAFWHVLSALWRHAQANGLPTPSALTPDAQGRLKFEACCPVHDDKRPSLSVGVGEDRPVVLHCQAQGCNYKQIAHALDIPVADLSRVATDDSFEEAVQKQEHYLRTRAEAQRRIATEAAGEVYKLPTPGRTLADDLAVPPRKHKYTINELHPAGGNSLLVAQYKTGKTTLLLNLACALADRQPFLGRFDVTPLDGRVAFWNYELNPDQFREWARDIGIKHPERVAEPLHLRGTSLPLWLPDIAEQVVEWLTANQVQFLVVDPAAQAWRGLVDSENDNVKVGEFLHALDEIKRRANVPDLVLATHMGRAEFGEDAERSRGATRLQDWMDAGWYLRRETSGTRTLRADGRDVDVAALDLTYNNGNRRLAFSGQTREQRRDHEGTQVVVNALSELERKGAGPITTKTLEGAMSCDKSKRTTLIKKAEDEGLIEREKKGSQALVCSLTDAGRERASHRLIAPTRTNVVKRKRKTKA